MIYFNRENKRIVIPSGLGNNRQMIIEGYSEEDLKERYEEGYEEGIVEGYKEAQMEVENFNPTTLKMSYQNNLDLVEFDSRKIPILSSLKWTDLSDLFNGCKILKSQFNRY